MSKQGLMRIIRSLVVILLLVFSGPAWSAKTKEGVPADGTYIGRQKMKEPASNEGVWYYENILFVKDGEAILEKVPINVIKGETLHSASDGGFWSYRLRFTNKQGKSFVMMRLFRTDYVYIPKDHRSYSDIKTYPVKITAHGFTIDETSYKPYTLSKRDFAPDPSLIDKVLLEKPQKSDWPCVKKNPADCY